MDRELLRLAERTASRLRKTDLAANTIQIKIRQSDFKTYTRQRSVKPPAGGTDQIYAVARGLLQTWLGRNPGAKIRLLGVGGSNLVPAKQPDLFAAAPDQPSATIDQTVDEIRDRGVLYERLECFQAAGADYEHYLALAPHARDAATIRGRLNEMRKITSRFH